MIRQTDGWADIFTYMHTYIQTETHVQDNDEELIVETLSGHRILSIAFPISLLKAKQKAAHMNKQMKNKIKNKRKQQQKIGQ